jgi:exopolysaccharide production protein ExoQ
LNNLKTKAPMTDLTRPIRVVFNTREKGYRTKTWTASAGVFTLMAGDAVRYSIGWVGWGITLVLLLSFAMYLFFKGDTKAALAEVRWPVWVFTGWMTLSILWSAYPAVSALAVFSQISTTAFALFLAAQFSWRHLLRIFANVIRFILGASLVFEFLAAAIVQGPIAPIFKNYEGSKPPAAAYYWTQGNLFDGDRIQGIVGNSNLLAFVAMLGVVVFAVEYAIIGTKRWLSAICLLGSLATILLAKSAGIGFAMTAVVIAAIVSIAAEGKDRETRHRYYRVAYAFAGTVAVVVGFYRAEVFEFFGKSPDMTGRSGIWKLVLGLVEQRPVAGWGWTGHWMPGVEPFEGLVVIGKVPYYQAHNAYLDVAMQLGLIGAILFALLLLITFVKLWRLAVRHTVALYLWPILVFMGLLVWSLTESRMLIEIGWTLLMLFAIKVNEPEEMLEPRGRSPKRARIFNFRWRR